MPEPASRSARRTLVALIKKWRMEWAVVTVILYVLAVPFTIWKFPDNNLWLALIVLFTGFTAGMTTLGDMLVSAEEDQDDPAP